MSILNLSRYDEIPANVIKNDKIKHLTMFFCDNLNIKDDIEKMTNLTTFILNNCSIDRISSNIARLLNLKTIVIQNCNLTEIPPIFAEIPNLNTLDLSCNKITSISMNIIKSKKLTHINIKNNPCSYNPIIELFNKWTNRNRDIFGNDDDIVKKYPEYYNISQNILNLMENYGYMDCSTYYCDMFRTYKSGLKSEYFKNIPHIYNEDPFNINFNYILYVFDIEMVKRNIKTQICEITKKLSFTTYYDILVKLFSYLPVDDIKIALK